MSDINDEFLPRNEQARLAVLRAREIVKRNNQLIHKLKLDENLEAEIEEEFTNDVISYIYNKRAFWDDNKGNKIVFLLLGRNAQKKAEFVNMDKVVTAAHPSPLSANNGFLGTDVFQRVEKVLGNSVNWSI